MAQATFDLRQLPFRHLRKKNVKRGTLERSKHYKDFVKDYQANPERYENVISLDQMAEEIKEKEAQAEGNFRMKCLYKYSNRVELITIFDKF